MSFTRSDPPMSSTVCTVRLANAISRARSHDAHSRRDVQGRDVLVNRQASQGCLRESRLPSHDRSGILTKWGGFSPEWSLDWRFRWPSSGDAGWLNSMQQSSKPTEGPLATSTGSRPSLICCRGNRLVSAGVPSMGRSIISSISLRILTDIAG